MVMTENIAIGCRRRFDIALMNVKSYQKIRYAGPMRSNVERDRDRGDQSGDVMGLDESRR
jgi:hypothetical protein